MAGGQKKFFFLFSNSDLIVGKKLPFNVDAASKVKNVELTFPACQTPVQPQQ